LSTKKGIDKAVPVIRKAEPPGKEAVVWIYPVTGRKPMLFIGMVSKYENWNWRDD
jgi:hypothetical protein